MMRVALRNSSLTTSVRPIGSRAALQVRLGGSSNCCLMTTLTTTQAPLLDTSSSSGRDRKSSNNMLKNNYRANVLMAVAAVVSLRPIMTLAEGRVKSDEESSSHLKYPTGKPCPTYGCPLFPIDIVPVTPTNDPMHNTRHDAPTVLKSLAEIRNSTNQELTMDSRQSTNLTTLSSTASQQQATVTMTGFKGGPAQNQINQDRAIVVGPYYINDEDSPPRTLLGVFDGHAARGEIVSEYVVSELPKLLAVRLREALSPSNGVVDDIVSTTKRVLGEVFVELDKTSPADPTGGCTATVILYQGDTIYVANAGDSVSMVGVYQKSTKQTSIVYTSREDKPSLPDERQRVEAMGGYVYVPPRGTSRVVYVNPRTGAQTGLAMSRSIGDWSFGKLGVIPDPIVDTIHVPTLLSNFTKQAQVAASECWTVNEDGVVTKVTGKDCEDQEEEPPEVDANDFAVFAISATDGMMDYVAKDGIAAVVAQALYEAEGTHPATAGELLVNAAASGWDKYRQGRYRDDIAIAMASLVGEPNNNNKPTEEKEEGIKEEL